MFKFKTSIGARIKLKPDITGASHLDPAIFKKIQQAIAFIEEKDELKKKKAEFKIDFNHKDALGRTIFDHVILGGHKKLCEWILLKSGRALTPLEQACKSGNLLQVNSLLAKMSDGAEVEYTAFILAVMYGHHAVVLSMIAQLTFETSWKYNTACIIAAQHQDVKMLQLLVDAGFDATAENGKALSVLIDAKNLVMIHQLLQQDNMYQLAIKNSVDIEQRLKKAGIAKTISQLKQRDNLKVAYTIFPEDNPFNYYSFDDCFDFEHKDASGRTLFEQALLYGHKQLTESVIEESDREFTPIEKACRDGELSLVNSFMASLAEGDEIEYTAFLFALMYKQYAVVRSMLDTLVFEDSWQYETVCIIAARQNDLRMLQLLVNSGFRATNQDALALSIAIYNKSKTIVDYLLEQKDVRRFVATNANLKQQLADAGLDKAIRASSFGKYEDSIENNMRLLDSLMQTGMMEMDYWVRTGKTKVRATIEQALSKIAKTLDEIETSRAITWLPNIAKLKDGASKAAPNFENLALPLTHLHAQFKAQLPLWLQDALTRKMARVVISYEIVGDYHAALINCDFHLNCYVASNPKPIYLGLLRATNVFDAKTYPAVEDIYGYICCSKHPKPGWVVAPPAELNDLAAWALELRVYLGLQNMTDFKFSLNPRLLNLKFSSDDVAANFTKLLSGDIEAAPTSAHDLEMAREQAAINNKAINKYRHLLPKHQYSVTVEVADKDLASFPGQHINKTVSYDFKCYELGSAMLSLIEINAVGGQSYSFGGLIGEIKPCSAAAILLSADLICSDFRQNPKELSFESYGLCFNLGADGALAITRRESSYESRLKLKTAGTIIIAGLDFQELDITAEELKFNAETSSTLLKADVKTLRNNVEFRCQVAQLKAACVYNDNANFTASQSLQLDTYFLSNVGGSLSGESETKLKIKSAWYSNDKSVLGARSSNTKIDFGKELALRNFGFIVGKIVSLDNPMISGAGVIDASMAVTLNGIIRMPGVDIQSTNLRLLSHDFELKAQSNCAATYLELSGESHVLKYPFITAGFFVMRKAGLSNADVEETMQQRFGLIENYDLATLPQASYSIGIAATIQADKGIYVLCPEASIYKADNSPNTKVNLLAMNGPIKIYATDLDVQFNQVFAKQAMFWLPRGIKLGHLLLDTSRRMVATFYSHAHRARSYNLGGNIRPMHYEFLGQNYDSRMDELFINGHLVSLPAAISNGVYLSVAGTFEVIGGLTNRGTIDVGHLKHRTIGPSLTEAGLLRVRGDCELHGLFGFKPYSSEFVFQYINYWTTTGFGGTRVRPAQPKELHYQFCNSNQPGFEVAGNLKVMAGGHAQIYLQGAVFDAPNMDTSIGFSSGPFEAGLFQEIISCSEQEFTALQNAKARIKTTIAIFGTNTSTIVAPANVSRAVNDHHSNIHIEAHALGFLARRNNCINAQKTIHSQIGLGSQSVLNASGHLNGVFSAADLLILVSGNTQIFPSRPVRHGAPPSVVSNLAKATFNSNAVVCNPNAGQDFVPGADIQIAFRLYEAAWFNQNQSLEFYLKIFNDIVVINSNGVLSTPRPQAIFSMSPQLLVERIKEDFQRRLHRPRIYFDKAIDLDSVRQLYRNGHNWLKANNLITNHSAVSASSQALALLEGGKHPSAPTEPMLFCQAINNDAGQEEYITHLYLPRAMLEEVWAMGDGPGFMGKSLAVFSDNLTPEQNLALLAASNSLASHKELQDFYAKNPHATKNMRNNALQLQAANLKQLATAPYVQSSTIVGGKIITEQLFIAVNNRLEINADIVAKHPFLASLLDDVEIRSLVARVYGSNHENFQDVIQNQVRIYAEEKLQIFAAQDVIFKGAQTTSGQGTDVYAGRDMLDFSVNLVMQYVQRFYEGYRLEAHIKPAVSHHTTSETSDINMHGGRNVYVQGIVLEALHASFTAEQGEAIIDDAIEQSLQQQQLSYETGGFFGKEVTHVTQNSSSTSLPTQFNVKETLTVSGKTGTKLKNTNSGAKLNVLRSSEGQVFFLLGVNHASSVEHYSSSGVVWVKSRTTTKEQHYFSDSNIRGLIEVAAKDLVVEQVRAKHQDFIARIEFAGDISYKPVDEYCNIKTKKVQGPGPGLVMLVNAVVTALTFNPSGSLASSILGGATSGTAHTALTAGFVTLSTRAAVALV